MKIYDYKGRKNISGNRIREARLKKRLSQADFVADYELMIIAEILDVTVDWLLSEDCE